MRDHNCVFCRIVAGEIPCLKIHEDDHILSFLDIGPLAEGHTLVIPKDHVERLEEMAPEHVAAITAHLPRLARAVLEATRAPAYNLLQNNGAESGQVVPHVHFHIIPRFDADGLGYRWNAGKYEEGRAGEVLKNVLAALGA